MSKAFVKDDQAEDPEEDFADESPIPGGKNYITVQGAKKLRSEQKHLLEVERPEVVKTVSWAASNGDRSENGDYLYGKKRLREIDRRIRFLSKRLEKAEIIDPTQIKSSRIVFGATVTVSDSQGKESCFRIVGIDETDAATGKISWVSPIGKALLQAQIGDLVTVKMPKGEEEYEILKIKYEEIS